MFDPRVLSSKTSRAADIEASSFNVQIFNAFTKKDAVKVK